MEKLLTQKCCRLFSAAIKKEKRTFSIKFNRAYLTNAAAVVAAIVLSFFFSTPIENTEVVEENYAKLLPDELFEKIEKQSLAITPIVVKQNTPTRKSAILQRVCYQQQGQLQDRKRHCHM